jgi:hypothetical protein
MNHRLPAGLNIRTFHMYVSMNDIQRERQMANTPVKYHRLFPLRFNLDQSTSNDQNERVQKKIIMLN